MIEPFKVAGKLVQAGESRTIDVPMARLYTHTEITMPVVVIHGKKNGPRLFICASIHGDEINGVEIIRRVLENVSTKQLSGTLLAVPIVNVFGFITHSRYLPDRRDLNRSFPGSLTGSLAARLAHLFMREIVLQCNYGIDLHTAASPRTNLPQIRTTPGDEEMLRIADAFAAPVTVLAKAPGGSLRREAIKRGVKVLLYEAGESAHFNSTAIETGFNGILRVMHHLGMVKGIRTRGRHDPLHSSRSAWIRARQSGILHLKVQPGDWIQKGQQLGIISDPLGEEIKMIKAPWRGLVIGQIKEPLVYRGDAVLHLASIDESAQKRTLDTQQNAPT
ncbi:MAG: succinylglutamate desuccinylase/aspartoacylase family protein [Fidelibacterota bacterium]|nr:MAG: succinylglutamate desuccinylase/aspartoacylase family protein [Candidatus Neomarinimicrobiota bacterium]